MPELMFVVKSFLFAIGLMVCLQVKVGSTSLENHLVGWVHTSQVGRYLQNVSDGAVRAIHNGSRTVSSFMSETFGQDSSAQKAGRLNFEFKRSQRYYEEQEKKNQ